MASLTKEKPDFKRSTGVRQTSVYLMRDRFNQVIYVGKRGTCANA
jgi:hypothetical protein